METVLSDTNVYIHVHQSTLVVLVENKGQIEKNRNPLLCLILKAGNMKEEGAEGLTVDATLIVESWYTRG